MASSGKPWEPSEDEILAQEYPRATRREPLLLALPGRSWTAIADRASELGLRKAPEALREIRWRFQPPF